MKVGIYGGSFNPIHIGHTELAKCILDQHLVEELWFLVSPLNPLKQTDISQFAPYDDRLRMAELATKEIAGVRVSDFENHLPRPSYMITTLRELQKAHPQHEFLLVIGADNFERFPHWYKHEEILAEFPLLVYNRPGYTVDLESFPGADIRVVDTPLFDISSTELRSSKKSKEKWLDKKVIKYIQDNQLYASK